MNRSLSRHHSIADLRLAARGRLPRAVFDYMHGAAEDEVTLYRNQADFDRYPGSSASYGVSNRVVGPAPVHPQTLCPVRRDGPGPCQVSFFGGLTVRQVDVPEVSTDNNIAVASLRDIFGMKCATVPARSENKDYLDIHALITTSGLRLAEGIACAKAIYGTQYNPMQTLQALCYFADLPEPLPEVAQSDLLAAVNEVNLERLPEITASRHIAGGL